MRAVFFTVVAAGCGGPDLFGFVMVNGGDTFEPAGVAFAHVTRDDPTWTWEGMPWSPTDTCGIEVGLAPTTGPSGPARGRRATVLIGDEPLPIATGDVGTLDSWNAGASIGLSTTGLPPTEVPEILTLPELPQGTTVAEADGSLTVTWTPGDADVMLLTLFWDDAEVHCEVADDGAFTVRAADLAGPAEGVFTALIRATGDIKHSEDGRLRAVAMVLASGDGGSTW